MRKTPAVQTGGALPMGRCASPPWACWVLLGLGFALAVSILSCLCIFSSCWVVNTNMLSSGTWAYLTLKYVFRYKDHYKGCRLAREGSRVRFP